MTIAEGGMVQRQLFGGAPLSSPTTARPIILPTARRLPNCGDTDPDGRHFAARRGHRVRGNVQYVSFMSVKQWGSPGQWTTNYAAIAYSTDNGENFTVAP